MKIFFNDWSKDENDFISARTFKMRNNFHKYWEDDTLHDFSFGLYFVPTNEVEANWGMFPSIFFRKDVGKAKLPEVLLNFKMLYEV